MVLVASQWFSVVLTGSRRFSVVFVGSQCSRRFSITGVGTRGAGGASAPLLLNEGGQSPLPFVMIVAQ